MQSATSPIRLLLLASALALASNCADKARVPPPADLTPPRNILQRADRPVMPPEAATSEDAFEDWRENVDDWGEANAGVVDRACWWFKDAGVPIDCREPRPPM